MLFVRDNGCFLKSCYLELLQETISLESLHVTRIPLEEVLECKVVEMPGYQIVEERTHCQMHYGVLQNLYQIWYLQLLNPLNKLKITDSRFVHFYLFDLEYSSFERMTMYFLEIDGFFFTLKRTFISCFSPIIKTTYKNQYEKKKPRFVRRLNSSDKHSNQSTENDQNTKNNQSTKSTETRWQMIYILLKILAPMKMSSLGHQKLIIWFSGHFSQYLMREGSICFLL